MHRCVNGYRRFREIHGSMLQCALEGISHLEMELDSRTLELTGSAVAHGRINIRACGRDFFPASAFGASSRSKGRGTNLCLRVKGLGTPILTDIPTDASGQPRWFFRERAWVKAFVRTHGLGPGAK